MKTILTGTLLLICTLTFGQDYRTGYLSTHRTSVTSPSSFILSPPLNNAST